MHNTPTATDGSLFCTAMEDRGYDGIFFPGDAGRSGLGIFWDKSVWRLASPPGDHASVPSFLPDLCGNNVACINDLISGNVLPLNNCIYGVTYNCDMLETWHRPGQSGEATLLPSLDRRNVALVRLVHRETSRSVWFVNVHLMTESRDNPRRTTFPGEVRAGAVITALALEIT